MLVTVLATLITNINYLFTIASPTSPTSLLPQFLVNQHLSLIEKLTTYSVKVFELWVFVLHIQMVLHNHQIKYSITKQGTGRPNKIFSDTDFIFDFACLNFEVIFVWLRRPDAHLECFKMRKQCMVDLFGSKSDTSVYSMYFTVCTLVFYLRLRQSLVPRWPYLVLTTIWVLDWSSFQIFYSNEKNKILVSEVSHSIKSTRQ